MKFVPKGPNDNKAALDQVMAWQQTGNKPLPEPVLTQFTDAYMKALGGDELTHLQLPHICVSELGQYWFR